MYNLNWHRSFDFWKLVDARRRARSERAFMPMTRAPETGTENLYPENW